MLNFPHTNHTSSIHFFTKYRVMSDPCFDARDCLLT